MTDKANKDSTETTRWDWENPGLSNNTTEIQKKTTSQTPVSWKTETDPTTDTGSRAPTVSSRKHAYMVSTPLNPTFIQ